MHLNDSFGRSKKIKYYCTFHEQAAAMAAEAYSKITGKLGVCVVTGGPGGSNSLTGIVCQWQDSVPALYISGQVRTEISAEGSDLRQLGEQELNITDIVKPVTKYAVRITDPQSIRYHLEKAIYLATTGRPGPVWIDVPLDIQAHQIEEKSMVKFDPEELETNRTTSKSISDSINEILKLLQKSNRPVILAGNGIRISGAYKSFLKLVNILKIPVLTASCANDLMYEEYPLYFGNPGIIGDRTANFIIQNSDLVLSIGARLNFKTTGFNYQAFAREAKIIFVNIDANELNKKTVNPYMKVEADAKVFIEELIQQSEKSKLPEYDVWVTKCKRWTTLFPKILPQYLKDGDKYVNPYFFMHTLSSYFKEGDILTTCSGVTSATAFLMARLKKNQRFLANIGCGPMGYELPSGIGASIASGKKPVIVIVGDGSLQFNIHELQTLITYELPLKIFVYDNKGYLSIRNTQKKFAGQRFFASDANSGVVIPNLSKIAYAYGMHFIEIKNHNDLHRGIKKVLEHKGPVLCRVNMAPSVEIIPRIGSEVLPDGSMISKPLEDMYPYLPREIFFKNMIAKPLSYDKK